MAPGRRADDPKRSAADVDGEGSPPARASLRPAAAAGRPPAPPPHPSGSWAPGTGCRGGGETADRAGGTHPPCPDPPLTPRPASSSLSPVLARPSGLRRFPVAPRPAAPAGTVVAGPAALDDVAATPTSVRSAWRLGDGAPSPAPASSVPVLTDRSFRAEDVARGVALAPARFRRRWGRPCGGCIVTEMGTSYVTGITSKPSATVPTAVGASPSSAAAGGGGDRPAIAPLPLDAPALAPASAERPSTPPPSEAAVSAVRSGGVAAAARTRVEASPRHLRRPLELPGRGRAAMAAAAPLTGTGRLSGPAAASSAAGAAAERRLTLPATGSAAAGGGAARAGRTAPGSLAPLPSPPPALRRAEACRRSQLSERAPSPSGPEAPSGAAVAARAAAAAGSSSSPPAMAGRLPQAVPFWPAGGGLRCEAEDEGCL